ncbi:MAG: TrfB-related DNA-binding protein [Candidatus Methylumidiphilus sp.]
MRVIKRLTEAQFDSVRPFLRVSEKRIQSAYEAMVLGKSMTAISLEAGWCKQAVSKTVGVVWEAYQRLQKDPCTRKSKRLTLLPPGWTEVTLVAPDHVVEKIKRDFTDYVSTKLDDINDGG